MVATVERYFDLELVKKAGLGLAAAALLIIPIDISLQLFSKFSNREIKAATLPALQKRTAQPLDHFESAFQAGGLFGGAATPSGLTVLKTSISEMVKDYRLKGVVILSEPEAIIQDARTQQSIFVKAGEKLGELTVKEIREGKIVLTYYGEETALQIE